jgi:enterobactin synthetase component D / holo-[acyl-carrier protein] synthase
VLALDGACCVIGPIGDSTPALFAIERETLSGVVAGRAAQFAAGRHCARLALRQLGMEEIAIPVGEGGAPRWPAGVTGSISHGADLAGAIVARAARYSGLGLDIERRGSVTSEIHQIVFTVAERSAQIGPDLGALLFSAKESVYKAVFPQLRRWIDFSEVTISIDAANAKFHARASAGSADLMLLESGEGLFAMQDDAVVTLFYLPA